jgi:small-conductance mechanosensitive channel
MIVLSDTWRGFIYLAGGALLGLVIHYVFARAFTALAGRTESHLDDALAKHCRPPSRIILPLLICHIVLPSTNFPVGILAIVREILAVGLILSVAWFILKSTDAIGVVILEGIIVGFAAQRSLATLLAGIQIALTQPIRIEDVVIVENEWGRIEEITLTYVVIRIWDLRRLIVPITYFIDKPFQNWTRGSTDLLGTVLIYADYTLPIRELRKALNEIVNNSERWDGKVCALEVTDASERGVEMRALVSASNASRLWDLRCEVRERLIEHLQQHHGTALPKTRVELEHADLGDSRPQGEPSSAGRG